MGALGWIEKRRLLHKSRKADIEAMTSLTEGIKSADEAIQDAEKHIQYAEKSVEILEKMKVVSKELKTLETLASVIDTTEHALNSVEKSLFTLKKAADMLEKGEYIRVHILLKETKLNMTKVFGEGEIEEKTKTIDDMQLKVENAQQKVSFIRKRITNLKMHV